jgi:hypothetical protein
LIANACCGFAAESIVKNRGTRLNRSASPGAARAKLNGVLGASKTVASEENLRVAGAQHRAQ